MSTTTTAPKGTAKAKPAAAGSTVEATTAPAKPKVEFVVLKSEYGIDGNRIAMAEVKHGNKLTNKMAGSDPAHKVRKTAIITATVNGVEVTRTFAEGQKIVFHDAEGNILPQVELPVAEVVAEAKAETAKG